MILAAVLLAGAAAPAMTAPLSERIADVATRFCVDLVSHAVPLPSVGEEEQRVFARYGLSPGVPNAAMTALGPAGTSLLSRATLASGLASDGAFAVALGGTAGETCRIIVYRAPLNGLFSRGAFDAMTRSRGWKALPPPPQPAAALRVSLLKRDATNRAFVANLITPVAPGPVAMVVNIAEIPPNVAIPQGY